MRILICVQFVWFVCCGQNDCKEGINKLPMYGRVEKCKDQLDSDKEFLIGCDKEFKSRQEGARYYVEKAWGYFYSNQLDLAMKRFNQSWLLDSLNADIYWGFGNILGMRDRNFKESIIYFERSLKLNPNNSRVWESASTSYGNLFFETKNETMLDKSISCLKNSLKLDSKNARAYAQLTAAYCYFTQKDSARKYLTITDKLDPKAVNPEVRKILSGN
ncbi:MAG: hypothetical protein QM734_10045 [Cyclobacteriaceae bacterium]